MIEGMQEAAAIMRGEAHSSTYRVHIPANIDTRAIRDQGEFVSHTDIDEVLNKPWS